MTRRTQEERRQATRQAFIDAAGELLVERGWAHVTSVAVCERAGLTRGAFVHHFDGLPDLFAAVLDGHYGRIVADIENRTAPTTIAELVERTWATNSEPRFKLVLEAWQAAAHDPDLSETLGPVIANFAKLVDPRQWVELLTDAEAMTFYLSAREATLGLALGRATNRGRPLDHEGEVVAHLIAGAQRHDARLGHGGTP